MMNWLLSAYSQVPTDLRPAILALAASFLTATATIAGIFITNLSASGRQAKELLNAEKRQRLQRELDLKKSVYLETLNSLGILGEMVRDAWFVAEGKKPAEHADGAPFFQAYLVAGPETTKVLLAAQQAAIDEIAKASPIRMRYEVVKHSQAQVQAMALKVVDQRTAAGAKLDSHPESAGEERNKLEGKLSEAEDLVERAAPLAMNSLIKSGDVAMDMLRLGAESQARFTRSALRVIVAMRDELQLPTEKESFLATMEGATEQSRSTMTNQIKQVSTDLAEILAKEMATNPIKRRTESRGAATSQPPAPAP